MIRPPRDWGSLSFSRKAAAAPPTLLAEIDENLIRADLTASQRSKLTKTFPLVAGRSGVIASPKLVTQLPARITPSFLT
jgi:hypothetical protein